MRLTGILAPALLFAAQAVAPADGERVLIVDTRKAGRLAPAMEKFRQAVAARVPTVSFDARRIEKKADIEEVVKVIRESKPNLVVAVESAALDELKKAISDVPILFIAALQDLENTQLDRQANHHNLTGVSLTVPPAEQLRVMSQAIPGLKRVGVIYTPKKSGDFVEAARREAPKFGIEIVAEAVTGQEQVAAAVERVMPACDAYWLVPDSVMMLESPIRTVLERAWALKKPTVGFDSQHARAGCYIAIYCDVECAMDQSARIAAELLGGKAPMEIAIEPPRVRRLTLNLPTADALEIDVPDSVRTVATEVIEKQ